MLVIGFHTISEALAVEKAAKEQSLPGRLGPVPKEVSVGCGYAWLAENEDRHALEKALNDRGLGCEAFVEL